MRRSEKGEGLRRGEERDGRGGRGEGGGDILVFLVSDFLTILLLLML